MTGICQRAVKLAIRECIEKHAERTRLREEAGTVDEVDDYDPVPEITRQHFEWAMADVRVATPVLSCRLRSVGSRWAVAAGAPVH